MIAFVRRHANTFAVAFVTAAVTAGAPAIAATIADYARDSDKVDGRHAVGARTSIAERKGRLVATNADTGQLPNNIIARAPDANRLDGLNSTEFALASHHHDRRTFAFSVAPGTDRPLAIRGFDSNTRIYCLGNTPRSAGIVLSGPTGYYTVQRTDGAQSAFNTTAVSTAISTSAKPTGTFTASVDTTETAVLLMSGLISTPTDGNCRVTLTFHRGAP